MSDARRAYLDETAPAMAMAMARCCIAFVTQDVSELQAWPIMQHIRRAAGVGNCRRLEEGISAP